MQFRPCIDLRQGKVTQIVGSTLRNVESSTATQNGADTCTENFTSAHPASYYSRLYSQQQLSGGHIIMLGPGNEQAAIDALQAAPGTMQVGGGININNAKEWLERGATHVIVTSSVFSQTQLDYKKLADMRDSTGKDRLVLDLSCRRKPAAESEAQDNAYYVVTNRWQTFTDLKVNQKTLSELSAYCSEFLIHGVDVEGKQQGIEVDLLRICAQSPIPVTYAGGVRSLDDISLIREIGRGSVHCSIGSALDLFGGALKFEAVLKHCSSNE